MDIYKAMAWLLRFQYGEGPHIICNEKNNNFINKKILKKKFYYVNNYLWI